MIITKKGEIFIAIFHLSIKIFSRGKGASVVAKSAYRAAEKITSEYDGKTSDYTNKTGVVYKQILLPEHAPKEYQDRAVLWNEVEKSERYKTAQLAREIEVALPHELTEKQNIRLVREYVKKNFVQYGMIADLCVHDKGDGNPHAHIMLTMRALDEHGNWLPKSKKTNGVKVPTVDWNDKGKAEIWRADWADMCNEFLEHINVAERIDNRSFERQGIDKIPTVHLGVAACQMERKGIRTERGNINRNVQNLNSELRQLKARIRKLEDWLKSEIKTAETPMLYDVISDILNQKSSIKNLKSAANMLVFLQENGIKDVADLERFVTEIHSKRDTISDKIKPIERRLKTLEEHITQADYYFEFKAVYQQYAEIAKPKKQTEFYETHRREITLFETAKTYIDGVMNGKRPIPRKSWKAERETLIKERDLLYGEYRPLKEEVKNVEVLRRNIENLLNAETRDKQRVKANDLGL